MDFPRAKYGWRKTTLTLAVLVLLVFVLPVLIVRIRMYSIPTGAMAPTIQGRHKDLVCPKCGTSYRVGASSESNDRNVDDLSRRETTVVQATCPNCRFAMNTDPETPEGRKWPSRGGDRILVARFSAPAEPKRWDVVVFRYPMDERMNFVKRLVGLPNETIKISQGDIYTRPEGAEQFEIARKPAEKVLAMGQTVYDNDHVADSLTQAGWLPRWQPVGSETAWSSSEEGRSFEFSGSGDEAWIRYRHFIPSQKDWSEIKARGHVERPPSPHLIIDFYAYDTGQTRMPLGEDPPLGVHWVGDLLIDLTLDAKKGEGTLVLDLVKGGRHFDCRLNLQTGEAALAIDGLAGFAPVAQTAARGPGRHQLTFANVDRQLLLWIDGQLATFSRPTSYDDLGNALPTSEDLAPAGIAARGANLKVEHLTLKRDIYYIAKKATGESFGTIDDYDYPGEPDKLDFTNPDRWTADSVFARRRSVEFALEADQFFMLGDNSPFSKDSRLWADGGPAFYVRRDQLIGRVFFVYWPEPSSVR